MPPNQLHVSDLLVVIGQTPENDIARLLRDRPALEESEVRCEDLGWGSAWIQHTFEHNSGHESMNRRVIVGRPAIRGQTDDVADWLDQRDGITQNPEFASKQLSGMFAVFEFENSSIHILTDRLGFRPVYIGRDEHGKVRAIGTHAESVAAASGTGHHIDPVSVAELLVHNYITYPFTTRTTMTELPPASLTTIHADTGTLSSSTLWEPTEPKQFPSANAMRPRIADAMREAAVDITRGCDRIGVLLSGGADSRAVLGAVLDAVDRPEQIHGLTYVTRENNETRVAARIAEAAGCTHVMVQRDEHYFPRMLKRGLALLGCELRGNCHGLGVADQAIACQYDVVIGGQLSDTLLKDHFMSIGSRHAHRTPTLKQRMRNLVPGMRRPAPASSMHHTTGRELLEAVLTDDIRRAVRQRKEQRLEVVRSIRPNTAEMWNRFWPCSRQDDSAHTLGNTRIMVSDTLFAHSAIIDVASELSLTARVDGIPANLAITDVCGPLADIENANNGLPINATSAQIRTARKARRAQTAEIETPKNDSAPWNAVETSWVDPKLMQQNAPEWIEARERLAESDATMFLNKIIQRGGDTLISSYQDDLPSNTNHIAVQIALWLDATLEPARSASVSEHG
ncbi:MAG: asparagine synthase-related protein [Phycisphaerales bacterium]